MEKIQKLQDEIKAWSDETFGKYRTSLSIAHHLKKEVAELIEALEKYYRGTYSNTDGGMEELEKKIYNVKMEFADCFILLLDAASHFPITTDMLFEASEEKLEIVKAREWAKPDENGVIEHIRLEENPKKE